MNGMLFFAVMVALLGVGCAALFAVVLPRLGERWQRHCARIERRRKNAAWAVAVAIKSLPDFEAFNAAMCQVGVSTEQAAEAMKGLAAAHNPTFAEISEAVTADDR